MNTSNVRSAVLAALPLALAPAFGQNAIEEIQEMAVPVDLTGGFGPGSDGFVRSRANAGAGTTTLEWYIPDATTGGAPHQVLSTAVQSSRISDVDTLPEGKVLIVGQRVVDPSTMVTVGTLELLEVSPIGPTIMHLASVDIPDCDPIEIEYDPEGQTLFMVDRRGRRVLAGAWTGSTSLPATFDTVTDYAANDALARPRHVRLADRPNRTGCRVYDASTIRYRRYLPGTSSGTWIEDASQWSLTLPGPSLDHRSSFVPVNEPWDLNVLGPVTYPLELELRAEGGVDQTVTLSGPGSPLPVPAAVSQPGTFLNLFSEETGELSLRTCLRYGKSQNTDFVHLGEVECDLVGPFSGRSGYTVVVDVLPDTEDGLVLPTSLSGEIWIAFGVAGAPPVVVTGDQAVVAATMIVPFSVPAGVRPADLSFQMPAIPHGLDGIQVFTQIAVTDGANLSYSDVFGIPIRATNPVQ